MTLGSTCLRQWLAPALLVCFALVCLFGIGARQPLTGDETIVLSVSETLVRQGRLGAPIFEGVSGAERHYFASLPLIHLLHWPAMKLFGADAPQARAVSLVLVLVSIGALAMLVARKSEGVAALAVVVAFLFWRTDLIDVGWGLPLHTVARSVRYDAAQLAFLALTFGSALRWMAQPSRWSSLVLGGLAGASVLTHFLGLIAPAMVLAAWVLAGRERPAFRQLGWAGVGLLVVVSPYLLYLLRHWADATTQFAVVHAARADAALGGIASAVTNVLAEPRRYAHLFRPETPGPVLLLAAVPAVGWWVFGNWSAARDHAITARVSAAYFLAALGLLAVFEPTKAPLYALPLMVPVCLVIALAAGDAYRNGGRRRRLLLAGVLLAVSLEGVTVMALDWRASVAGRTYADISREIAAVLSPPGNATGASRWWWRLRSPGYVPFVTLQYRATLLRGRPAGVAFDETWQAAGIRYLVRTPEFESDVVRADGEVTRFLNAVVRDCGRQVLHIDDVTYGPVDVFALTPSCPPLGR